jgi:hypothetical protein
MRHSIGNTGSGKHTRRLGRHALDRGMNKGHDDPMYIFPVV